jgi:hypothetical protein
VRETRVRPGSVAECVIAALVAVDRVDDPLTDSDRRCRFSSVLNPAELDHVIRATGKAGERIVGAHHPQRRRRRFQTGRRNDYRARGVWLATLLKPDQVRVTGMEHENEIHETERTAAPCQQNALDPVRNPPTPRPPNHDIQMTGFSP